MQNHRDIQFLNYCDQRPEKGFVNSVEEIQDISLAIDLDDECSADKGIVVFEKIGHCAENEIKKSKDLSQGQINLVGDDEYAVEIFLWKFALQKKYFTSNPLAFQPDVTAYMRECVLKWLGDVNTQFKYSIDTYCLAVALMDRFLSLQPLHPDCLQMISLTAFFIAAKLEEVEPPDLSELVSLCASAYNHDQFKWMEGVMLNQLRFDLHPPTLAFFLQHFVEIEKMSNTWPWNLSGAVVQKCVCNYELVCGVMPAQLAHIIFNVFVENLMLINGMNNQNPSIPMHVMIQHQNFLQSVDDVNNSINSSVVEDFFQRVRMQIFKSCDIHVNPY